MFFHLKIVDILGKLGYNTHMETTKDQSKGYNMTAKQNEQNSQKWDETLGSEDSQEFLSNKSKEILEKFKAGQLKPLNDNEDSE